MNWDSERAVRLMSEAKCQTNFNKSHFVQGLKRELSPAENRVPWCMAGTGSCLAVFWVPGFWVLLTILSCTPLQTCHHHGGFALSSAEQSQGHSPGFNKSSTISGPKGIGSTLDPSCLILPQIAYAWVDWTSCPKGFLAVPSSWDSFSKFTLVMLIFVPPPLPDSSELQCHFRSYLIWEHIPAPEKEQAFIPACALSADLLTKLYM